MTQLQDRKQETATKATPLASQEKGGPGARWYAAAIGATVLTGAALIWAIGTAGETSGPTSSFDPQGEVSIVHETTGLTPGATAGAGKDPTVYYQRRQVASTSSEEMADPYEEQFWSRQADDPSPASQSSTDQFEEQFWAEHQG